MPFVKLDVGILDSTLWLDRPARDIFITALLMSRPKAFDCSQPQLEVRSLACTGWHVPAGEYGFVAAAGPGIVSRAGLEPTEGLNALERLCRPEAESRSQAFEGRRLARVDGGYIVLNYMRYREQDRTNAERQARFKMKKSNGSNAVTPVTRPLLVTQADVDGRRTTSAEYESSSDQPRDCAQTRSQQGRKAPSRKETRNEVYKKIGRQFGGKKCSPQNSPPTSTPNENSSEP